jgi:hypothetical protein
VALELERNIAQLLSEIEAVDPEMFAPQQPIGPRETVLGTAPLFSCKCFALAMHYTRELEHAQADHKYTSDEGEKFRLQAIAQRASQMARTLAALQWYIINDTFKEIYGPIASAGLRKGWKVVMCPEGSGGISFLARLLGLPE